MKEKFKKIFKALNSVDWKKILSEILEHLLEFFKILNRLYEIFKSNIINIVLFSIYFIMTWNLLDGSDKSFWITVFIYFIPLSIALSPLGELILRYFNKVRKLETTKEKEYLIPLFDEICEKTKKLYPNLNKKIQICIIDVFHINALALGKKTIAVTKGTIETLSAEELKGFIAHEMAHIVYYHTQAILFIIIAEKIFNVFINILKAILKVFENMSPKKWYFKIIIGAIKLFLKLSLKAILLIMQITNSLFSLNSRLNEYRADKFAYEMGYGRNLVSALYVLESSYTSSEPNITNKLKDNHPILPKRIGRLEKMIDSEETEREERD